MARTLGGSFTTEKNLVWARPFNSMVVHFGGAVGDIYLSDRDVTISSNAHKGLVSNWGRYRTVVEPRDGAFQVHAMDVEILNFPVFAGSPLKRFSDLFSGIGLEGVEVDVYQNFTQLGGATILQEALFAGVVRLKEHRPRLCKLEITSVSDKYLDQKQISFAISADDFPAAQRGDIGKRASVVYGSVKLAPCLAVAAYPGSILRAAMDSSQTTVPIYDEFHDMVSATGARTPVTTAHLVTSNTTTDANSFATGSITPTANALVLAFISNTKATTPDTPTLSGNSLTWVQVATVLFASNTQRLTVFRAMGASPSSGAVTIAFGGVTQTACGWSISQYPGADTSGTDGSAAVIQSVTNSGSAVASLTVTLAPFERSDNFTVGGFANTNNGAITAGTGFTAHGSTSWATPNGSLNSQYLASADTSVDATFASSDCGGIAVEVAGLPHGVVHCDGERMTFTGKGGSAGTRTLTGVTRATDVTDADAHLVGARIFYLPPALYYLVAGHAAKAVSAVYVKRGGVVTKVDSTRYNVELANTTLVSGRTLTLIKLTVPPLKKERWYEQVDDSITSDNADFGAQARTKIAGRFEYLLDYSVDTTTVASTEILQIKLQSHTALKLVEWPSGAAGIVLNVGAPFSFVDDHFHTSNAGTHQFVIEGAGAASITRTYQRALVRYKVATQLDDPLDAIAARTVTYRQTAVTQNIDIGSGSSSVTVVIDMGAQEFPKVAGKFRYKFSWLGFADVTNNFYTVKRHTTSTTEMPILIYHTDASGKNIVYIPTVEWEDDHWHNATDTRRLEIIIGRTTGTFASAGRMVFKDIVVEYDILNPAIGVETEHLLDVSSADMIVDGEVLVDLDGYADDGSGTYTGSANALIEKPADVIHHLARVVGEIPSGRVDATALATARSDAPGSYKFAAVLNERAALKTLLLALGMQSRTRVDWPVDKLTARFLKTSYGAVAKTLTQEHIMDNTIVITRSGIEDLINTITLHYERDWSEGRSPKACAANIFTQDSTSVTSYGTREQVERFLCDFIGAGNATMAQDLADFWLARLKQPARIISFQAKLDQYEILPGDLIAIDFKTKLTATVEKYDGLDGSQKFLVEAVEVAPGSARDQRATRVALVVREVV